jgi:hypothetical protein
VRIITRAEWGFDGWLDPKDPPTPVNEKTDRTEFFTHYQGGPTRYRNGFAVPRSIHAMHKANGWKGIGYGHVVTADGSIYEGRGFNLRGSHCPDHNVQGYSAQIHIGGDEKPTDAQLTSQRWLYDEACRRSGRTLAKKGHRDGTATACPGSVLYAWVRVGMPAPTTAPAPLEDDVTPEDIKAIADEVLKRPVYEADGTERTVGWAIGVTLRNSARAATDATVARTLAEAAALKGAALTADEVKGAVKAALSETVELDIAVKPAVQ